MKKEDVREFKNAIIEIHNAIIENSGGEHGIRDDGGLDYISYKILNHLHKTKDPFKIGVFIFKQIAQNHYFLDGNKRTAYLITEFILLKKGHYLTTNYKNAVNFIIKIANYHNPATSKEIEEWLRKNTEPVSEKNIQKYIKEIHNDIFYEGKGN